MIHFPCFTGPLPRLRRCFVSLLLCGASGLFGAQAPVRLSCEDLIDPLGIDAPRPRLSWILQSAERGARQSAYQVQVASQPDLLARGTGDRWDSGKVNSDQSVLVSYAGTPLASEEDCWWRVRVWDESGRATPWSAPAHWSMGLLQPQDWPGQWIGRDEVVAPAPFTGAQWIWTEANPPSTVVDPLTRYFRGEIDLPAGCEVRSAHLIIGASGDFVASVNGVRMRVLDDLAAGMAQDVDITWRLAAGRNLVAFSLLPDRSPALPPGVVARVEVDLMDGRHLAFATDGSWKASAFPAPGWENLAYDDSGWTPVHPVGEVGAPPWGPLLRQVPRRLAARWLRREFTVPRPVRRAMAYYSGLGSSELYVNGTKVGDETLSPGLSEVPERAFYVTHEVTALLRPGANAVGAILGNGRYYAPRRGAPFGDVYPKLMLKLVIWYQDGGQEVIGSDRSWRLTDQGPIRANSEYDGEEYDARMELPHWSEPGFADQAWQPVQLVSPGARVLSAEMFAPIRVTGTLPAIGLKQTAPGVYIFDLGQNLAGRCRLRVRGPAGTQVVLRHAETVGADGRPHFENLRTAMATDTYILKGGGEETYEPRFATHGFRYVEMRGYPGEPGLDALEARVVGDDLEKIGTWSCSNDLLNRIYANMAWGIRSNYRSIPTDCPQRDERQGWTGDRVFESKGESFVYDTAPLYHKWFQDMADTQRADGSLSDVCPSFWPYFNQDVTWPGALVISPEALYEQFGDSEFFTRNYPAMRRWVAHMEGFLNHDLMPNDRYGDWCPPPDRRSLIHTQDPLANTSGSFLATAHFQVVLRLMAQYAQRLGQVEEARSYAALAQRVKTAFNQRFLAADGRHYDTGSQTSFVLPLAFDLAPVGDCAALTEGLARRITTTDQNHVGTGLVGIQQLMRTLTAAGQGDLAYRLAVQDTYPSWGYMVRHGATTVWELWDGDTADIAMNSGNHVMLIGDAVIWLYEDVAGIKSDPEQPGFRHILMRPTPVGDLRFAKAGYRSPYGLIVSEWRKESGTFAWNVGVPPNSTATLFVPASSPDAVTEGGAALERVPGIRVLGIRDGRLQLEVGAGSYRFLVQGG
jgi:alpha-L-rhamnosidase